MAAPDDPTVIRKPRADAQRNRLRLLETAKVAFAEKGANASLDEIAKLAEVGIGTLYRHFPTRDALVEAVYRNELEQLTDAARHLVGTRLPVEALREWLLLFVHYMATKRGMAEILNSIAGGTANLYADSGAQIQQAVVTLVDRAVANGDIRLNIDPMDLLRALAGVVNISADQNWRQSAERMIDILIAGIQSRPQTS